VTYYNVLFAKFKLFGGEAAKVIKCVVAKVTNAAARQQSALEYYFFTCHYNQTNLKKHSVKLLRI